MLLTCTPGSPCPPVDYQMHTVYSDGDSTIEAYAERAAELGLEEIAITDHVWRTTDWVAEYVDHVREVEADSELAIHAGVEAKVIDRDGRVDVSAEDAERVDFVMGVVHRNRPEASPPYDDSRNFTPTEATSVERDLTLALLDNPTVDVVGHPTRNYYKFHHDDDAPPFPDDYLETVVEKANDVGTPLEYNARLPRQVRERLLAHYVAKDHEFTIGSDSHDVRGLEKLDRSVVSTALTGARER